MRALLNEHWHPLNGTGGGGTGNLESHATVILQLDNGASALLDGMFITIPVDFAYDIVGYRLIEDTGLAGSVQLMVSYATAAAFPGFTEISGTQRPTLSNARADERTQLGGWTLTSGEAYSQLRATVIGNATNITRCALGITLERVDTTATSSPTGDSSGGGGSTTTGTTWFNGNGVPSPSTGNNGDYYLDDSTGNVYTKASGAWGLVFSFSSSSGGAPTTVPAFTTYTVKTNTQVLFALVPDIQGVLDVQGAFVQVD